MPVEPPSAPPPAETTVPAAAPAVARPPAPVPAKRPRRKVNLLRWLFLLWGGFALGAFAAAGLWELETSRLQARVLAEFGQELHYNVGTGAASDIRFPRGGPFDERRGYSRMAEFVDRLKAGGFEIERQAAPSPRLVKVMDLGLQPPYREKPQAGLTILDRSGARMFGARFPERVYPVFGAIPPVIVRTLSFIEDRNVVDAETATYNPAIDWRRFAKAVVENAVAAVDDERRGPGGSTLATQLEKMRHSPEGITKGATEKLRQIASASLRAYRDGAETWEARQRIITEYLNSLPLGATPWDGEVIGLAQGLAAWYGADFDKVNALLADEGLFARMGDAEPVSAIATISPAPLEGAGRGGGVPPAGGQKRDSFGAQTRLPPSLPSPSRGEEMTSSGAASQAGLALKQVVSLIIAQRHPSRFLGPDRAGLAELTDAYLRVLAENEVIDPALRDRALAAKLRFRANAAGGGEAEFVERPEFVEKKGTNAVRGRIAALLGLDSFYDLDRLDLTVESEIDAPAQNRVTAALLELRDPKRVAELGLKGFRLLDRGDPAGVTHSFSLYERGEGVNWLRVQTDNVDQPFSMVEGAKIDLGSTAKLRTLVTYLDIVAALHAAYAGKPAEALRAAEIAPSDVLSRWAVDQLLASPGLPLRDLLDRAMQRPYSASPTERFFTGGGVHEFHNFDSKDDNRVMSVAEAFRNSVNLVFVRLMRDVVAYYQHRLPNAPATLLADPKAPERLDYLRRFADREGRVYLGRFYAKYRGLKGQEITDKLIEGMRLTPTRLVAAMRYLYPDAGPETLDAAFDAYLPEADPDEDALEAWHEAYAPDRYDLVDRAYTMGVHPLELWLAGYLAKHPEPSWSETVAASANERIEVYRWLYRTSRKRAQDVRIKGIIEIEAFLEVHQQWQKLGYPFDRVVPSLATSIGASADRPSALADLMGILLNDGVRMPTLRVERLHFAAGTPYETVLTPAQPAAERVLPVEVARVAREALADVVANGTARRVHKAFPAAGQSKVGGPALAVGGKTGTGDHREKIYARGNQKVGERVRGRAATFVFYVGDRFYGIVTAYVAGAEAADYRFTSGLPVQILAHLAPTLREIIDKPDPARDERLIAKTPPDKSPPALQPEPAALKRPRRRSRGSWQFPGASLDFRRARSRPPGSPLTALRRKKGA